MLFWLIAAHFIIDYPLQGDTTAKEKNPHSTSELQRHVPWYYWMTAHSFMHGAAVAYITQSILLGIFETVCHFSIDVLKCNRVFNIHVDQLLHIALKVLWCFFVWFTTG